MRILSTAATLVTIVLISAVLESQWVLAKKPSSGRPVASTSRAGSSRSRPSSSSSSTSRGSSSKSGRAPSSSSSRPATSSRRRPVEDEEEFDDEPDDGEELLGIEEEEDEEQELFEDEIDDEGEDFEAIPKRRSPPSKASASRKAPPPRSASSTRRPPPASASSAARRRPTRYEEEDDYDDYDEEEELRRRMPSKTKGRRPPPPSSYGRKRPPPPRRGGRPPPRRGEIVPYGRPSAAQNAAASLSKGWTAFVSAMPDPTTVKEVAVSSFNTAKETTSSLSSNLYREVKGLTSSELEQVMLKATRPDDSPVKGKHVERLVGVTYQVNSKYDIYDAVLRKLWSKMAEKDWRTTMKALYILHRFAADGAPEHAQQLKQRLRQLRRMRDPKRKEKYFNSKQLLAGDSNPDNIKFRAFMSRYAHYVLLRAQCFGGMFEEIGTPPKVDKKKPPKPITSTNLRAEHLEAAAMLLNAGIACQLKDGEECENCAIATERVASDMIGLTTSVAMALNRALKDEDLKGADPVLLKKWCVLYSEELLPKTRAMVKKTSPKLDAYGLFLPARMGTTVPQDILERGLNLEEEMDAKTEEDDAVDPEEPEEVETKEQDSPRPTAAQENVGEEVQDEEEEPAEEEDEEEEVKEKDDAKRSAPSGARAEAGLAEEEEDEDDEYEYEYEEEEEYFEDEE